MNSSIRLICNHTEVETPLHPGTTVLDFVRKNMRLTGTKEGCREGDCGACTVLVGSGETGTTTGTHGKSVDFSVSYRAVNSCLLPLGDIAGIHLVTIEGLNPRKDSPPHSPRVNPIQRVFVEQGASQCGFCTPGFIVSLTNFFLNAREFTLEEALSAVSGNICRCTGYTAIKRAVSILVDTYGPKLSGTHPVGTCPSGPKSGESHQPGLSERLSRLIEFDIVPDYFAFIPERVFQLHEKTSHGKTTPRHTARKTSPKTACDAIVAGGTDLYVQNPENLLDKNIRFILSEPELRGIVHENGLYRIGACTPVDDLKQSHEIMQIFPRMKNFLELVASPAIRRRATVGGNIVNASPIGDLSIFFLALEADLILQRDGKTRTVPLKDFFLDYKKLALRENELVQAVTFKEFTPDTSFNFEKVSRRTHLDIASVNSAMKITTEQHNVGTGGDKNREGPSDSDQPRTGRRTVTSIVLSAGGVAPVPLVLEAPARHLEGNAISSHTVRQAAEKVSDEINPISDIRGTADYKRLLLRQLIYSHFVTLFPNDIEEEQLV